MGQSTLVVMAAGIGSRFGGVKQLEPVGPGGEVILEYSVYDAIRAGFSKVVFIIRREIEADFKEVLGNRIEKQIDVEYVFQELSDLPEGYKIPEGRNKPWGTGQAVLACRKAVSEPFVIINADDYYGRDAFKSVQGFLSGADSSQGRIQACMAGFQMVNTLSAYGSVTRGVCEIDAQNQLTCIHETKDIRLENGQMVAGKGAAMEVFAPDTRVSMNMFGFTPNMMEALARMFPRFLDGAGDRLLTAEFLIPTVVGELLKQDAIRVSVLNTADRWFGVTYREDLPEVKASFQKLVDAGVYPGQLFAS